MKIVERKRKQLSNISLHNTITDAGEQSGRIERKLDVLNYKVDQILNILSGVLVEADYLKKVKGLNKKTISQDEKPEKFNEIGKRKLLLKLEAVPVVQARKRSKKRS